MKNDEKLSMGLIVGNRGFFPDKLARDGRELMIKTLKSQGLNVICLSPEQSKYGCVETFEDAKKCAELFAKNKDKIAGIVVTLPNFGDEKGIAESIKRSELNVPILIHAFSDNIDLMTIANRRDSFCGKISVCNNLNQYGIPFTLTSEHTSQPNSESFKADIHDFAVTCKVIRAMKNLRVGAVGARPAAFNTCRFSEKLLQEAGISVETLDLSEIIGKAEKIKSTDPKLKAKNKAIANYAPAKAVPKSAIDKMSKLAIVLEEWINENEISALAIQCWTALEEFYGVVPCTVMSMLSNSLIPAACEVDVPGAISMYILQSAAGKPAAILDWNNNYGAEPDKAVMFHCSNIPADFFDELYIGKQEIIAGAVGKEKAYGTVNGKISAGPATFLRISTDETIGEITGYLGEGEFTNDKLETFGGAGVMRIDNLQALMKYICQMGFEHHVAAVKSQVAEGIMEALTRYKGWEIYFH